MDGSEVESEDYTSESYSPEDEQDFTELCAFVKYNKEFKREGLALIYIPDNYILTEYKDGKRERGYVLYGNNCLKEVTFENDEIVHQAVIEATPGILRDPTGTLEFDGYIQDDSPMGFGSCKDIASNQVIYKGYMIGWERNIEGISRKDNKKVYNGSWCANKRCGYGIEYDEKEMILREGYWFDDEFIQSSLYLANPLNPTMNKWEVNNSLCSEVLELSGFQALEEITFNSKSFETVGVVNITGLPKLRKIEFKANSFSMFGYANPKRSFRISDCPLLESIDIEKYCFTDYTHFELSNLDSLETLKIGYLDSDSFNFYEASFSIQGISSWSIGSRSSKASHNSPGS